MKHTPGPWVATHADGNDLIVKAGDIEVVAGCGWRGPPYMRGRPEADARLIAAAPDLLEALHGVLRVADRATDEFDAARAAIAKATTGGTV